MDKCRWHCLSNKESVVIIVWYAIYALCYETSFYGIFTMNQAVFLIIFIPTIVFYCMLGLLGEVFIGRQRLINFSMWVQWIAMIMSSLITAFKFAYDFSQWLEILLVAVPSTVQFVGLSAFQVTAVQFGIDQIQGAPSKHLVAFVYWYFCIELVPKSLLHFIIILLSNYIHAIDIKLGIRLGCCLFCVVLLSFSLCVKSCFMSSWFLGDPESGTACTNNGSRSYKHNPYSLIYHVIKFALKHKHPLQRSALTYWEDELPSRIDLGKSKYGGPFTSEEVDNVKMLFQLIAVLASLLGIFFVSFSVNIDMYHRIAIVANSSVLIPGLYDLVMVGVYILLFLFLFLPCCHKCLPKMLKRIWIGAVFTVASALSMILIGPITSEHAENEELPCVVTLNPYLVLIPMTLCAGSYIVLTISIFEFIVAQSPQTMKGMLIGLYYTFRFGLAGLFVLADYHVFKRYYPTHNNVLSCPTTHFVVVTFTGILSLLVYTIVAYKYKPRERDEVVNVHIFAEEYYTK